MDRAQSDASPWVRAQRMDANVSIIGGFIWAESLNSATAIESAWSSLARTLAERTAWQRNVCKIGTFGFARNVAPMGADVVLRDNPDRPDALRRHEAWAPPF